MKRIHLRWATMLVAPALLASACVGSSESSDGGKDKSLSIALSTDVATLHPWMTKTVPTDMSVISQIYQSLTVREPDLSIKPLLAKSWSHPAPDEWTFKLRAGVTFSNGDPFDSSVVKWNIDKVIDPVTKARIAPNMANIASVSTPNTSTVTIKTKTPDTTIPALMSYFYFVDPKWAGEHELSTSPMGTGPYTLGEWQRDSQIELKARKSYWGKKVSFDIVKYKILPDPSTQLAALQSGLIDFVTAVSPDQMDRVKAMPDVEAGSTPTVRSAFLMFNTKNKPMNDPRVRQALNYAVDKEAIVKSVFHGLTNPSPGQVLTKEFAGYNEKLSAYPYDPAKAKELLAAAGKSNGLTVTLSYPSGTYLLAEEVTQIVKQQLSAVGVKVNVQPQPYATWLSDMYAGKLADAAYLTYSWPTLDGMQLLRNFGPGGAQSFWTDKTFGSALDKAGKTADPKAHEAAISDAAKIMRDEAPFLFLFPQPLTYAHSKSLHWTARPDDWVRASDMTQG